MSNVTPDHSEAHGSAYRVYLIGQDGKVESSIDIAAENDEAAIEQLRELPRTYEAEL